MGRLESGGDEIVGDGAGDVGALVGILQAGLWVGELGVGVVIHRPGARPRATLVGELAPQERPQLMDAIDAFFPEDVIDARLGPHVRGQPA